MSETKLVASDAADAIFKQCRTYDFGKYWKHVSIEHRIVRDKGFEVIDIDLTRTHPGDEYSYLGPIYHASLRIEAPENGKSKIAIDFSVEYLSSSEGEYEPIRQSTSVVLSQRGREICENK